MKRHGQFWDELTSFPNLLRAFRLARRGKRQQANVIPFEFHLERELWRLQQELRDGSYKPGVYRTFHITTPKPRLISAAPFRNRIVHHALCRVLERIFEPTFIFDSYACRRGKGTHAAVNRYTAFARKNRYVLKCDISKYFPSIDHALLKGVLARKIKDPQALRLIYQIIDHSNPQEEVREWFPGDDLFAPSERRRGLPLGNQTSQFFANVYLNPFDHFVKQTLRTRCYIRYVDDFVLLDDDKRWLAEARERCRDYLATLRLRLHPHKAVLSRTADGIRFLGYRVFPTHRLLPRSNVTRMKRRLCWLREALAEQSITEDDWRNRVCSWIGHAQHADVFGLYQWLFAPIGTCEK